MTERKESNHTRLLDWKHPQLKLYAHSDSKPNRMYTFNINDAFGVPRIIHKFRLNDFKVTAAWYCEKTKNIRLDLRHQFVSRESNYSLFLVKNRIVTESIRNGKRWIIL